MDVTKQQIEKPEGDCRNQKKEADWLSAGSQVVNQPQYQSWNWEGLKERLLV